MTARKAYVRAAGGWLAVSVLVGFGFADAPQAGRQMVTDDAIEGRVMEPLPLAAVALPQGPALTPSAAALRP